MRNPSTRWLALLTVSVALSTAACSKKKDDGAKTDPGTGDPATTPGTEKAEGVPEVVRVTGIPDENPTELQRKYEPMVKYLEEKLGTKVEYVPVIDYGAAVQALEAGKVDFAWLGGFTHVQARVMTGAVPLCQRDIDREFRSVFIANSKSGVASVADMKGKPFAFGSKSSTSGHLMPRHFLVAEHKIDPDKDFKGSPLYSDAHDATVKLVESGKVAAGALNIEVWERMNKEGKVDAKKVKVVWTTPGYIDYVWTARKEMDEALREKFKNAFLELDPGNPAHVPVLELQGAKKFVPAVPADFDTLEQIARKVGLVKS
jgi:phosphonate transport system substrate-binding protein